MEDETRDILRSALSRGPERPGNPAASIRARFAPLGGVDLPLPARDAMRPLPFGAELLNKQLRKAMIDNT